MQCSSFVLFLQTFAHEHDRHPLLQNEKCSLRSVHVAVSAQGQIFSAAAAKTLSFSSTSMQTKHGLIVCISRVTQDCLCMLSRSPSEKFIKGIPSLLLLLGKSIRDTKSTVPTKLSLKTQKPCDIFFVIIYVATCFMWVSYVVSVSQQIIEFITGQHKIEAMKVRSALLLM